jgi:hypothetical protein
LKKENITKDNFNINDPDNYGYGVYVTNEPIKNKLLKPIKRSFWDRNDNSFILYRDAHLFLPQ